MRRLALPHCLSTISLLLVTGLCACTAAEVMPFTDDAAAQSAPYPALIPLGPLLAQADAARARSQAGAATGDIAARLAALDARAAALRGPVVPDATSARLANAVR